MHREGLCGEFCWSLDDILLIAPYNLHVFDLKDRIPDARIGLRQEVATDEVRDGEDGGLFPTRSKISSHRPNAGLWVVRQGRREAGCRSVVVGLRLLTRRGEHTDV